MIGIFTQVKNFVEIVGGKGGSNQAYVNAVKTLLKDSKNFLV